MVALLLYSKGETVASPKSIAISLIATLVFLIVARVLVAPTTGLLLATNAEAVSVSGSVAAAIELTTPIALVMPLTVVATPPSLVLVPAAFSLYIYFAAQVLDLWTILAMLADLLLQPSFRLFSSLLALCPIIRV